MHKVWPSFERALMLDAVYRSSESTPAHEYGLRKNPAPTDFFLKG